MMGGFGAPSLCGLRKEARYTYLFASSPAFYNRDSLQTPAARLLPAKLRAENLMDTAESTLQPSSNQIPS